MLKILCQYVGICLLSLGIIIFLFLTFNTFKSKFYIFISVFTKEYKRGYKDYPDEKLYNECIDIIKHADAVNKKVIFYANGWKDAKYEDLINKQEKLFNDQR